MNKNSFNLREARLAARKPEPFRLEHDVVFSGSGKHTDPYRCVVVGKRVRDRYLVSITLTHEPSQSIVHSDSWIFSSMEKCWDRYHAIRDVIIDIRDFIEIEGIQNVVAQYMIRHALSQVGADIENVVETAVPYIRQTVDTSTRGNLMKNFPTIPYRIQAGPDTMDEVYGTVTAPNPVPPDNIDGEFAYRHLRDQRKDKFPHIMSGFQEAAMDAGYRLATSRTGQRVVKTAIQADTGDFLTVVANNSREAARIGQKASIERYVSITGAVEEEASRFYSAVKDLCSGSQYVLSMSPEEALCFLASGYYEVPPGVPYNAQKEKQLARALNLGALPLRARLVRNLGTENGNFCFVLAEPERAALFNGNLERLRDPSRSDYAEDPTSCLYATQHKADCKATSIIFGMPSSELLGGPFRATEHVANAAREYGEVEVLLFDMPTLHDVVEVIAPDQTAANRARKILDKLGKILPVSVGQSVLSTNAVDEDGTVSFLEPATKQQHFQVSDRVGFKPRVNNPSVMGTIMDVAAANVTVQWDNGSRHVYDMAEALMRLLPITTELGPVSGTVVYSLPGMDEETIQVLTMNGIDPVTIHSLASHAMPASERLGGWKEVLSGSFEKIGLPIGPVGGFKYQDGDLAFVPAEWYEGALPDGNRLILEVGPNVISIHAGAADDYVVPSSSLIFE